ncbi:MAG: hypothetical protein ACR2PF_05840, partial [Rhizobiaceae bacterium]
LPDRDYVMDSGAKTIDAAADFTVAGDPALDGVVWNVTGAGASISPAGIVTLPTNTPRNAATVTVTATNSGGATSSAFSVTIAAATAPPVVPPISDGITPPAAGDTEVFLDRATFTSTNAAQVAFQTAWRDALAKTGPFAAATGTRRVKLSDGVWPMIRVGGPAVAGVAQMMGTGRDKCQVIGNWGLTGSTEPAQIEFQDILFTHNTSQSTVPSNAIQWTDRHNTIIMGSGVTLEGLEFSSIPNWNDRKLFWRRFTITGQTGTFAPGEEISFPRSDGARTGYTYVMASDPGYIYVDCNDADKTGKNVVGANGEKANHLHAVRYARIGGTVTGQGGARATISSNSTSHLIRLPSTQVSNTAYIRVFKFFGETRCFNETRWGADEELVWSGYGHHHIADYVKIRPGGWGKVPKKLYVSGLVWNGLSSKDINGSPHADGIQIENIREPREFLFQMENFMVGSGPSANSGNNIQPTMFNTFGGGVGKCLPGSFIRNCIFEGQTNGNSIRFPGSNPGDIVIENNTCVNVGVDQRPRIPYFFVNPPSIVSTNTAGNASVNNNIADNINFAGSGSRIGNKIVERDDYGTFFPSWTANAGAAAATPADLIRIFTPNEGETAGAITPAGNWVDHNGRTIIPGPQGQGGVGEGPVDPQEPDDNTPDPGVERDGALTPQVHDGDFVGHRVGATDSLTPGSLLGVQVDRLRARATGVHQLVFAGSAQPQGYTSVTLKIGDQTITIPWAYNQYRVTGQGSDFYDYLMANAGKSLDVTITGN